MGVRGLGADRTEKGTPVSPACQQGWRRELTSVFLQVIAEGTIEHAHEQRLGVQGFLAFLGPPPFGCSVHEAPAGQNSDGPKRMRGQ